MDIKTNAVAKVVVFTKKARTWQGRKQVREGDVPVLKVPPKDRVTPGSKHTYDPKELQIFNTIESRVERELDEMGIRGLGGWLIPEAETQAAISIMEQASTEWFQEKAKLLANVIQKHQDWVTAEPDWAHIIRQDGNELVKRIQDRVQFEWDAFKVVAGGEDDSSLGQKFTKTVGGLKGQLYKTIAEEAQAMVQEVLTGKDAMRAVSAVRLKKMRGKLQSLNMLDPSSHPLAIAKVIDGVLAQIPDSGSVKGDVFATVFGLAAILSDPDKMEQMGQSITEGDTTVDGFLCSLAPKRVEPDPDPVVVEPVVEVTAAPVTAMPQAIKETARDWLKPRGVPGVIGMSVPELAVASPAPKAVVKQTRPLAFY